MKNFKTKIKEFVIKKCFYSMSEYLISFLVYKELQSEKSQII